VASPLEIDAVVFDVLGTLVDEPAGIRRAIAASIPDRSDGRVDELLGLWQRHVDARQREVVESHDPYVDSTEIDREAAALVAAEAGVTDPAAVDDLAAAAKRLDPWPDAVLSSAARPALTRLSAYAGLRWHQVLSAADVHSYKPAPQVYELAVRSTGIPPHRLLKVAAHAWDLRGAQAIGMRTAYVERPVGDPPGATDSFDIVTTGLDELVEILG
jgi:2-haloacid dehalogenase